MKEVVEGLLAMIEGVGKMKSSLDEAQRAQLSVALRANADRLEGIEPNLPRIEALAEKRRAEIEAENKK